MNNNIYKSLLCFIAISHVSCATLETSSISAQNSGLTYFLPEQLTKVTVTRTLKSKDKAVKGLTSASVGLANAKSKLSKAESALKSTDAVVNDLSIPENEKTKFRVKRAQQVQDVELAKADRDKKQTEFSIAKRLLDNHISNKTAYSKAQSKLTAAEDALKESKQTLDEAESELKRLNNILEDPEIPETEKLSDRRSKHKQSVVVENKKKVVSNNETQLQNAKAAFISLKPDSKFIDTTQYKLDIKFELQAPTADQSHAYNVDPKHSIFRDDTHNITISPKGLLSSVNVVAADRTADAVVELATFAGALNTGFGGDPLADGGQVVIDRCINRPEKMIMMVDFAEEEYIKSLNTELFCYGAKIVQHSILNDDLIEEANKNFSTPILSQSGLLYRTPVDIRLEVKQCAIKGCTASSEKGWVTTKMVSQSLPQAGPISVVEQNSGFLTKTTYDMTFQDGVLTKYSSNRPSEINQFAGIPMRVIDGVFKGASQILSLRIGQNQKLTELSNSELALLQAQLQAQSGENSALAEIANSELELLRARLGLQSGENSALAGIANSELELIQARLGIQAGENAALADLTNSELNLLRSRLGLQSGENEAIASIVDSELRLLQAQIGLQTGQNNAQTAFTDSQLSLLQAQIALMSGQNRALADIPNSELERLRAQAALTNAQNDINAQAVASRLAALISITRDQSRIDLIENCINEKIANGEAVESCLETLE